MGCKSSPSLPVLKGDPAGRLRRIRNKPPSCLAQRCLLMVGCPWPGVALLWILLQCGVEKEGSGPLAAFQFVGIRRQIPSFLRCPCLSRSAELLEGQADLSEHSRGRTGGRPSPLRRGTCQAEAFRGSLSPDLPLSLLLTSLLQ